MENLPQADQSACEDSLPPPGVERPRLWTYTTLWPSHMPKSKSLLSSRKLLGVVTFILYRCTSQIQFDAKAPRDSLKIQLHPYPMQPFRQSVPMHIAAHQRSNDVLDI